MKSKILVVEDDPHISLGLVEVLKSEGFEVATCARGDQALDAFGKHRPVLVVLDVMLPGLSGYDVCKQLRAKKVSTPILMLTAKGQEIDKVVGLDLGADDYVTKPFSLMELLARVASVLRRAHGDTDEPVGLAFGGVDIDLVGQVATRAGKRIELPSRAFAILKVFARRPGEVVSRDTLLDEAWGYEDYPNTRTVDNHLVKLRRALEDEPDRPRYLVTIHGAGYKLDIPREAVRFADAMTKA